MKLSPVQKRFILHWGEIGGWSGINRTVAQIFALLYVSPKPLKAEEISETLSIARSGVSTALRELQGWRLIRTVHVIGDRCDHFETLKDVWEMFAVMMEERRRREFDPTREVLKECLRDLKTPGAADPDTERAIQGMLDFFESMTVFHTELQRIPAKRMKQLALSTKKLHQFLETFTGKKNEASSGR